jgi:hypothetical protein
MIKIFTPCTETECSLPCSQKSTANPYLQPDNPVAVPVPFIYYIIHILIPVQLFILIIYFNYSYLFYLFVFILFIYFYFLYLFVLFIYLYYLFRYLVLLLSLNLCTAPIYLLRHLLPLTYSFIIYIFIYLHSTASTGQWIMNWKTCGNDVIRGISRDFTEQRLRKPMNTSVRIAGIWAGIRSQNHLNATATTFIRKIKILLLSGRPTVSRW